MIRGQSILQQTGTKLVDNVLLGVWGNGKHELVLVVFDIFWGAWFVCVSWITFSFRLFHLDWLIKISRRFTAFPALLSRAILPPLEGFQSKNVKIRLSIKLSFLYFIFGSSGFSQESRDPIRLNVILINQILLSVLFPLTIHNPMICLCFCLSTALDL